MTGRGSPLQHEGPPDVGSFTITRYLLELRISLKDGTEEKVRHVDMIRGLYLDNPGSRSRFLGRGMEDKRLGIINEHRDTVISNRGFYFFSGTLFTVSFLLL